MRRALATVAIGAVALLAASVSCATFDYPSSTCRAGPVVNGAPASEQADCANCVEQSCCDRVGACVDEGAGCLDPLNAMHACVVDGGPKPSVEAQCGPALANNDPARSMYTCMRDSCGARCQLPACHVDPAALLVVSSKCDQCFSDSCCQELNTCYANRSCKLTVECIVTRCKKTLAAGLVLGAQSDMPGKDLDNDRICILNEPPPSPPGQFEDATCIFGCINEFGAKDPSAALDPHKGAFCLSTKIFQCAIRANCAESCVVPPDSDGGSDAADGSDAAHAASAD